MYFKFKFRNVKKVCVSRGIFAIFSSVWEYIDRLFVAELCEEKPEIDVLICYSIIIDIFQTLFMYTTFKSLGLKIF